MIILSYRQMNRQNLQKLDLMKSAFNTWKSEFKFEICMMKSFEIPFRADILVWGLPSLNKSSPLLRVTSKNNF